MNRLTVPGAPLSFAQSRIWLLNQITGPDAQYNVPLVVRFQDEVDVEAIHASLRDVVARHEILRTTYEDVKGRAQLAVCEPHALPELLTVETHLGPERDERVSEVSQHRFDLADQLPIHAWLLVGEHAGDVLVIVIHHIALDEASLVPLLNDLGTAYMARRAGSAPDWNPLRLQYRDYAASQREFLGDVRDPESLAASQLGYWVSHMAGSPTEIHLPVDRERPADLDTRGATILSPVPEDVRSRLMELARTMHVAPFTVAKAALAAFLGRHGAGDDIPLAGFVTGRFDGGLDDLVGFFVNTLVFRVDTSGAPSFRELVQRVNSVDIDAYSHQDIPFEEVVRALNPPRSSQRHPLAQVAISFRGPGRYALPGTDATVELCENRRVKFDLDMTIVDAGGACDQPEAMTIEWAYAVALFDAVTIDSIAQGFCDFLGCMVTDPGQSVAHVPTSCYCNA